MKKQNQIQEEKKLLIKNSKDNQLSKGLNCCWFSSAVEMSKLNLRKD